MEKIFIKPVSKEILLKGGKDGPTDLFSYESETDHAKRAFGNLYVVGNIQSGEAGDSEDLDPGYVINLVASLAKREYYAHADLPIKEAFTAALKKINGVVEEFFKKKETKINIGIFTIAGDEIHISKLGKFKILLARDGKTIDILNNIQLFNKENTQEKEFSSIISGKIHDGDRLLAYYPSRVVSAREKSIKENFVKEPQKEFAATLASIKATKPDFACAALHIELNKATEAAVEPHIQPKELQEVEPGESDMDLEAGPAAPLTALAKEEKIAEDEPVKPVWSGKIETEFASVSKKPAATEFPKIIPSEFALGKKAFPFTKQFRRYKTMNINLNPRNRLFVMGGGALVVILAIVVLKTTVFVSPQTKQINAAVSQAQANLKTALAKNPSDLIGARSLLVSSLATLADVASRDGASSNLINAKNDLTKALDGIENATDATLNVVADLSSTPGTAKLIVALGTDFYAYMDQSGSGTLVKVSNGATGAAIAVKNMSPTGMFASDNYITLVDGSGKVASLSIKKTALGTSSFSSANPLVGFDVYQDNLYGLTTNGITKITDAASGHTAATSWLQSGTGIAASAALITVDGKIYVFSTNGVLTTYFKGQKSNEVNTPITADASSMLLTNTNSPNLYLVDRTIGRIYVIKKDTGTLDKTLKTDASHGITSAALGADDTVYILSDNKIWEVK